MTSLEDQKPNNAQTEDGLDLIEPRPKGVARFLRSRRTQYNIAPILLVIFATLLFVSQYSLSIESAFVEFPSNLVKTATTYCLLAIGASMVIATSQIDLSSIGVATVSGLLFAIVLSYGAPHPGVFRIFVAVLFALIFATLSGLLVTFCHNRVKVPLLIFTWALGSIYVVCSVLLTKLASGSMVRDVSGVGLPSRLSPDFWRVGHKGFVFSLLAILIAFIIAHWTNLHERAAAVGASSLSAEYAGVPRARTYAQCFVFNALLASLAGIHHSLFLTQAATRDLNGTELTPIAIALLGGTSLAGGYLRLSSVVAAAFFWATVRLLGPHLTSLFPFLTSIEAELGQILFYLIFIIVSLSFGKLLAPRIPKVFARQEE